MPTTSTARVHVQGASRRGGTAREVKRPRRRSRVFSSINLPAFIICMLVVLCPGRCCGCLAAYHRLWRRQGGSRGREKEGRRGNNHLADPEIEGRTGSFPSFCCPFSFSFLYKAIQGLTTSTRRMHPQPGHTPPTHFIPSNAPFGQKKPKVEPSTPLALAHDALLGGEWVGVTSSESMQMPRNHAARKRVPAPIFGLALPSSTLPRVACPFHPPTPVLLLALYVGVNVHACSVVLTSICRRVWAHQKAEGRRAETPAAAGRAPAA